RRRNSHGEKDAGICLSLSSDGRKPIPSLCSSRRKVFNRFSGCISGDRGYFRRRPPMTLDQISWKISISIWSEMARRRRRRWRFEIGRVSDMDWAAADDGIQG
ncbi:hypothetical protein LINPERPRIM_LOCUS21215, partial [Linum perenne]